jgi:hypothetical protein
MAPAHRQRTDHDRVALPYPAVGDEAAEQRREIDETCVETKDLRCERLRRKRTHHGFDGRAESRESGDVLHVAGQQQLVHHVQHQERRHAVKGKALPGFGEGQVEEAFRMAHKGAVSSARRLNCPQVTHPAVVLFSCSWKIHPHSAGVPERRPGSPG